MSVTANPATQRPVKTSTKDALPSLLSEQILKASPKKQEMMLKQLLAAGVTEVDGWNVLDLVRGKINPKTGDRVKPDGTLAPNKVVIDRASGRTYGSKPHAPIVSLHQRGVIWTEV